MLRFLRRRLHSIKQRHRLLLKTICLSACVHGVLACIGMIGLYFSSPYTFVVHEKHIDKHVRIVLLPLQQRASKTTVQKQEHIKSELRQKKVTKKIVQNKQVQSPKHIKPKEQAQQQNIQNNITEKKIVHNKVLQDDEHDIYVGRKDLKELRLYKAVCHAVQKEWQPPAGMASTCACQITFVVGPDGTAHNVQVLESSKVLAYDIAARFAISRARFEAYARGKKCAVVFKQ